MNHVLFSSPLLFPEFNTKISRNTQNKSLAVCRKHFPRVNIVFSVNKVTNLKARGVDLSLCCSAPPHYLNNV